jgi:DNA-directed RNA polymerase beta' subunit
MSIYKELSFENDIESVKAIQFTVMSPEEIENKSVCEIVSTDTYSANDPIIGGLFDSRMGVIENDKICKTCNQKNTFCPGHFGHIKLAKPVFYIQFFDIVRKLLKCVCFRCSRLLMDTENPMLLKMMSKKMSRQKRFEFVYKCCTKIKRCGQENKHGCGAKLPHKTTKENIGKIIMEWKDDDVVRKNVYNAEDILIILKRISNDDANILGFPHTINRPENLICQTFSVPPPSVRPSVRNDTGQRCEDDLTHKLCDIIKTNNTLKQKIDRENTNPEQIDYWYILLQFHIATFVDNQLPGIPPAKQRTGRPLRSLTERLKSKEGRIRGNLMGKRVDFSARSVITPDPNIDIDELGVPIKIAMNLTFPEIVNEYNIEELYKLVNNGNDVYPGAKYIRKNDGNGYRTIRLKNLKKENIKLEHGDIVDRHLRNGDYVLFNRQPSLHKMSMMAHKVRVMQYETFRLNVCCTPSYNADYDGDEMNMHVPQSKQTEYELMSLASVPTQIISPRESSPIISVVQDIVVGLYRISKENVLVNNKQFFNILAGNSKFTGKHIAPSSQINGAYIWKGRELLSSVLNPLINLKAGKGVVIKDGVITSGTVDKKLYQDMTYGLIQYVYNELGADECKALFDNTQRLICDWLVYNGFSVGISDLIVNDNTQDKLKEVVKDLKVDVYEVIRSIHTNTFENSSIMNNLDHFENLINQKLDKATKTINNIGTENINDKENRMMNMINSKSKGNPINVSQMMGSVGQQSVEGKRIMYGFDNRTLPHFTKYDDGPESRGFVENSFIKGLTAQEFFFHAMGGREGLIDTAVKSVIGETEIIIIENEKVKTTTIGEWIDNHLEKNKEQIQHFPEDRNMEFLELPSKSVYIPTGDDKGVVTWGELTAVTRHDPGNRVFRVTTKSGRITTVADSESLLIWNEETREFKKMQSELVQIGDCVPTTEKLAPPPVIAEYVDMCEYFSKSEYIHGTDFNKAVTLMNEAQGDNFHIHRGWWTDNNGNTFTLPYTKKASLTRMTSGRSSDDDIKDGYIYPYGARRNVSAMADKFKLDRDNGRFVGLFLADGNACDVTGKVSICKNDEKVQAFVRDWFDKHGMKHKTYSRKIENDKLCGTSTSIQGYSTLMARFFDMFVGKGSANKHIPEVAFIAPDEFVLGLIEGYLTGDGHVGEKGSRVEVCSISEKMILGFALLLSRYGVFSKIKKTQQKSNNLGTLKIKPMYTLSLCGKWSARLAEKVELISDYKRERLEKMKDMQGTGKYEYETAKNMIVDPIVNIEILGVEDYPKLYDVTVPSTLNFITMNGVCVVDTSETGYIQRKLIKAMEDAKVNFDMTVRNASGSIIQFMYGEDSIDPIKLEKHHLDYLRMDVSVTDMEDNYLITGMDNMKYILKDKVIKDVYETDDWETRFQQYFKQVLQDREFIIERVFNNKCDDVLFHPIAVYRMIDKIESMFNLRNMKFTSDLNPLYVLDEMDKLVDELKINKQLAEVKMVGVIVRHYFSPKKLIFKHRFTKDAFDYMVEHFKQRYLESLVHPSDMVGVVAAQSIGEPSTQLTLNTFHLSGVASASKAVRGVPRIKELLSVSKNMKAPSCTIYLNDNVKNYNDAKKARYSIETTYMKSLVIKSDIYYEPNNDISTIEDDQLIMDEYKKFSELDEECNNLVSPWILRIELDRRKMMDIGLTTMDINISLKKYYNDNIMCMFSDDNYDKVIFRIALMDTGITDIITDLKALEYNIMEKIIIAGIEKMKKVSISQKKRKILDNTTNGMFRVFVDKEEYVLETDGTNLMSVLANDYVNSEMTISNDITEIYNIFGVEAARQALYNEIDDILNSTTSVNHRHIALLVDTMTCKGYLLSVDRHGINRSDIGPLAKCSFEETSDILIKAGVFGEIDRINGVSANIILGQIANCGTGDSQVIMDLSKLKNMEVVKELEDESDEMLQQECTLDFEYEMGDNIEVMEEKTVNKLIIK